MFGLNNNQKEAIGLLQVGTFLEYFDLMLYVHMAIVLNELFFPQTDAHTASLLSALAFCSTFIFRPFGALIFGWIGDNIGRKATVVITTFMMSVSCIVMANLPTYAQIGISAAWIVTICRIVQSMSAMGEVVGAEIYLTETIPAPLRYPIVASLDPVTALGGTVALGIAYLVTTLEYNWRIAFWIGGGIAVVGTIARTRLRETPDFVDMKRRMYRAIQNSTNGNTTLTPTQLLKNHNPALLERVNKKTAICLFFIQCTLPVFFYFAYVNCSDVLRNSFGYSAEQIIRHNLILSIVDFFALSFWAILSYKIYPLKILKTKLTIFSIFFLLCVYLLNHITTPFHLFLIQSFVLLFALDAMPAVPIFYKHFPVFKRFTYVSFIYALSRAVMFAITSFGLIYLIKYFGNWGILIIIIPITIGYAIGLMHFEKLEMEEGNYPDMNVNKAPA
jgi:MFS family permease